MSHEKPCVRKSEMVLNRFLTVAVITATALWCLLGEASAKTLTDLNLPGNPPASSDLLRFQTSVKQQGWRGSCAAHAFIGALEAAYVRQYGADRGDADSDEARFRYFTYGGITNACDVVCQGNANCGCEEFDLSEEYFIHIVHTTQQTQNPSLPHENVPSFCSNGTGGPDWLDGEFASAVLGLAVPKETFAPYFDGTNPDLFAYGTTHRQQDLERIVLEAQLGYRDSNGVLKCSTTRTQREIDAFEYDPRHIPLDARKNAVYGVTGVIRLSDAESKDTKLLEKIIASGREVPIGFDIGRCTDDKCTPPIYILKCAQAPHTDGRALCGIGLETGLGTGGHQVLLVGYDRNLGYFLAKNSWGASMPYFWISYAFLQTYGGSGYVITDIRDPSQGPSKEAMSLGQWDMDHDGHRGTLTIRRTRTARSPQADSFFSLADSNTTARIGTYYDSAGVAHKVMGSLPVNTDQLFYYVDFGHAEGAPDPQGTPITLTGQEFQVGVFYNPLDPYTFGNFAAGKTSFDGAPYGVLLNRQDRVMAHATAQSFSMTSWKDKYRLFDSHGTEAVFEVKDIGAINGGAYHPVSAQLGTTTGNIAAIDKDHANRLFFFGNYPDLHYHTWEKGYISGIGTFGLPLMHVPASKGAYAYEAGKLPAVSFMPEAAGPLSTLDTWGENLSLRLMLPDFAGPVDVYVAVHMRMQDPANFYFITPTGELQPSSAVPIALRANSSDHIDRRFFGHIPLSTIPAGEYDFYVLVTPAGSLDSYYLWTTSFASVKVPH